MKIFATILNIIMLCAILVICLKEGLPKEFGLLLIVISVISFNLINILALNKKTSKKAIDNKEKPYTKFKSMKQFGLSLIFIGLFLPSALYPLTTVDDDIHDIQVYSAMNGREYSPSFKELRLEYWNYNHIKYKYLVSIGIICVFFGSSLVLREIFATKSKGKMPINQINSDGS